MSGRVWRKRCSSARQPAGRSPAEAAQLLAARIELLKRIDTCAPQTVRAFKTRLHGDYHLGQVLIAQNDFVITDFEGEPARPLPDDRIDLGIAAGPLLADVRCRLDDRERGPWVDVGSAAAAARGGENAGCTAASWRAEP